jgi:ABC-type multidrug transport system ATPase subunit
MAQGLALRQVCKRYPGSAPVLDRVDLELRGGEVVAVTGGNGSGKSTLLRIIAGLSAPSAGSVSGRPRRVGYVPERFPGRQRMPAGSYLLHMGRIRGLAAGAARARAASLLRRLELVGGTGTPLRHLSKGNAQKVAIAQALMLPPELLVLDEPWSGLDAPAHGILRELIGEVAADGGAVVFTDHREAVVAAEASAAYRLVRGRLTEAGPPPAEPAHVVLALPDGASPAAGPPWERIPGVRRVEHPGPGQVAIRVADEGCDALLLAAIRAGWSVRSVRRHGGAPR